MSALTDVSLPEGVSPAQGFEMEFMTCNMADVVLTSGHFAAQTMRRASGPPRGWWLFRIGSGEAWFETRERRIHARPGALFLISLDDEFHGRITAGEATLLSLRRSAFVTVAADALDRACNIILSGSLVALIADHLGHLERRVVSMTPDELRCAGRATMEIVTACIQPSSRLGQVREPVEPVLFELARLYIENHLGEFDLTPERVAHQLRISRSNLYRAFEHVGGVARFILQIRLRAARTELLAESDRQVQEIAYRHGFKLASDFARAFRREFGISPREARERQRG